MADEPVFLNRPAVGGPVFWDRPGSGAPLDVVEGEVLSLDDRAVTARPVREWRATPDGWDEHPAADAAVREFTRADLDRLLPARIEQTKRYWREAVGSFKDDPVFEEIVRLGREYNESTRPADADEPTGAAP